MLNVDRIRLMTRLSLYEKREGRKDEKAGGWFRADYISRQMLISFICATIGFVILFVIYAFYNFEALMLSIYSMDAAAFIRRIILLYILFIAVILTITWFIYSRRYRRAQKGLRGYYRILRKLAESYGKDSDRP